MRTIACLIISLFLISCEKDYSNGERIFHTGKNANGEVVAYDERFGPSRAVGCTDCHGRTGGYFFNRDESIKFKDLSNPSLRDVPYTEALVERFLDHKLKSDGTVANTPIKTVMSAQDKHDLIQFLKQLK